MSGWQRFFMLFLFTIGILVCFPQYDTKGFTFMAMAFILWCCIIILCTVLLNLFALAKFDWLHRILSIVFLLVMLASLLFHFPLENNQTPISRLQNGQFPTVADLQEGARRLTFNFDFVRRNVRRSDNYVNQQYDKKPEPQKEVKKAVKKPEDVLDISVEGAEEN